MRESVYRDQLARVLEDARVKNAMMLEAQRQVFLLLDSDDDLCS